MIKINVYMRVFCYCFTEVSSKRCIWEYYAFSTLRFKKTS